MAGYVALFRNTGPSGWRVTFPDLPGCSAEGEEFGQAVQAAELALALCLERIDKPPRPRAPIELVIGAAQDRKLSASLANTVMRMVAPGG